MKTYDRQLVMVRENLENLPEICLPEGYNLQSITPELIPEWEAIALSAFGWHADYAEKTDRPGLCPERVIMVSIDGRYLATATSYNHPLYPGLGFLHMVAAHADGTGKGAGRLAVLGVLHGLAKYGLTGAVLTTDDFRLPAIGLYLSLGFEPVIDDEEMKQRWEDIYKNLATRKK